MFAAKFPGTCTRSNHEFAAGTPIEKNRTGVGYRCVECTTRKAEDPNALENAMVAREIAEDDYFAAVYHFDGSNRDLEGKFLQRMVDARMAAMLEADAVGIINLFDKTDDAIRQMRDVLVFGGVHPDIADGDAFGLYEREQEAAAYLSNPV